MRKTFIVSVGILISVIFLLGCASTNYNRGKHFLKKKKYESAIFYLKNALTEDPENPKILTDLGIAYYHRGDFERSLKYLVPASSQDTNDANTLFYLGLLYEKHEEYKKARGFYKQCLNLGLGRKMAKKIKCRLRYLLDLEMQKEAELALKNEKKLGVTHILDNSIAVLYFKSFGQSEELNLLSKGIADMLITDLSKVKKLTIIERVRLQKLFEEMRLGTTGIIDQSTAPRIGRLLGAEKLLNGTLEDMGEDNLRLDCGISSTKTKAFSHVTETDGELSKFFDMEKKVVFGVIDHLGISLSKEERDEIKKVPTESMVAFLAYCKGLDHLDQGFYEEATEQFRKALQLDPDFNLADKGLKESDELKEGSEKSEELEADFFSSTETADSRGERLGDTNAHTPPGRSFEGSPQEDKTPVEETAKVIIKGEIR